MGELSSVGVSWATRVLCILVHIRTASTQCPRRPSRVSVYARSSPAAGCEMNLNLVHYGIGWEGRRRRPAGQ